MKKYLFKNSLAIRYFRKSILNFWLLFFLFLSMPDSVRAQQTEEADTVTMNADTTGILPPTAEEIITKDILQQEKSYFLDRSDTLFVQQRTIPGQEIRKLKEDGDFWYADAAIKRKRSKEQIAYEREHGQKGQKGKDEQALREQQQQNSGYTPLGQRSWFQTFLWVIILGVFVIGLFIYLGGSNMGLFRKKNVQLASNGEEEIYEDIFAINYQKEIDRAAAQGNYRLAIRLLFLRLLKNMSEKSIIVYKQDKTNLDYLLELQPTNYYTNFFRITRNYEYSWYGQFMVSEDAYKIVRRDFDQFDKELGQK